MLLLGGLGLFPAQQAQADNVLVSNIGQGALLNDGNNLVIIPISSDTVGQAFTTGSAAGYILSSIDARLSIVGSTARGNIGNLKAELWSSNANGTPNAKIVSLTPPTSVGTGTSIGGAPTQIVTLTAPEGTQLARDTTYNLVMYISGSTYDALYAATVNEDAGAATGWSIADFYNFISEGRPGSGTWRKVTANTRALSIRVNGSALQVPTAPTGLSVTPGDGALELTWTAPPESVSQYFVEVTSSTEVAADARTGRDLSTSWRTDALVTGTSHTIRGLRNLQGHRVRVRAVNAAGQSPWAHGEGTPSGLLLSGLAFTKSESVEGTYDALALSPGFSGRVTNYTASVANGVTHVKVEGSVNLLGGYTMSVRKQDSAAEALSSGDPSGAIALDDGANVIVIATETKVR